MDFYSDSKAHLMDPNIDSDMEKFLVVKKTPTNILIDGSLVEERS